MGKKEFFNGLYPKIGTRDERLRDIANEMEILVLNRESLNKQINQLIFEQQILEDMNKLEKSINGQIELKPIQNEEEE